MNKKQSFKKRTRMLLALLACFPVFLIITVLLEGADSWLILLINLVIGGAIVFTVYLIGERNDERRQELHERHMEEISGKRVSDKLIIDDKTQTNQGGGQTDKDADKK